MSVDVRPVTGGGDLKAFIDLPFRLHANHPLWIPPLKLERRIFLNRRLNAYFQHADAEYFLARRDGVVVGRITAQINHAANEHHQRAWGNFGWIEFEDDAEVLAALLGAAHAWLQARGMERMVGPMDFAMNDECGILIEGYDLRPMVRQPWHPPYYAARLQEAGLVKAMDLLMWNLEVADRAAMLPILFELADQVEPKHGIRLRKMSRRSLRKDLDVFGDIYNQAWRGNWDFVPYGKKDLDALAQETQLVFDSDWMMVAERTDTGEAVASAMTFPDVNQVLEKMNGRLLPFGWLYFLARKRYMDRVRVGWLGVKPEYQHTGVAAKLYVEHFDMAAQTKFKGGEMGWILETNKAMNRGMEAMGGRVVKKYRMYERVFGD